MLETLEWITARIGFVMSLGLGIFLCLVVWLIVGSVAAKLLARHRILGVLFLVFSVPLFWLSATAVRHWGVESYHIPISVPQYYGTEERADMKALGLSYGYYYTFWVGLVIGGLGLLPRGKGESSSETDRE